MIPRDKIEEIKDRSDIVEVISEYVILKKRGANFIGLCPFHNEKTPSMSISPAKNIWHCFGCHEGGGVIDFVMKVENISFVAAIKQLAEKYNIEIKEVEEVVSPELKAMSKVLGIYINNLKENSVAKKYLTDRGLDESVISRLKLGYAKKGYSNISNYLKKAGLDTHGIINTGLVIQKESGELIDRYSDRIIFPICDASGNVRGFGGRIMPNSDKKGAKYINSPETDIYHKGQMLYGLDLSRGFIRKSRQVVVVEGYMDYISMYISGINNVVATLGTAMTTIQAKMLKNYSDEVIMAYDSDEAGKTAALKAAKMLYNLGLDVKVASFGSKDPDDMRIELGEKALHQALENAKSFWMFKIDEVVEKYKINGEQDIKKYLSEVVEFFYDIKDLILLNEYPKILSERFKIPEESILSNVKQRKAQNRVRKYSKKEQKIVEIDKYYKAQETILRIVAKDVNLRKKISSELNADIFTDNKLRKIYDILINNLEHEGETIVDLIENKETQKNLRALIVKDITDEEEGSLQANINALNGYRKEQKIKYLEQSIEDAQKQNNNEKLNNLLREFMSLKQDND